MIWQYTPYVWPLIVTAGFAAGMALYAWRSRHTVPGAIPLTILMLAVAHFSATYVLEIGSVEVGLKVFWAKVETAGTLAIPAAWLAFALQYTGQGRWLARRQLLLVGAALLIVLALVWTNESHHLFWSDVIVDSSGPYPALVPTLEMGYWLIAVYNIVCSAAATALLVQFMVRSRGLYRRQVAALVVASALPIVADVLSVVAAEQIRFDFTPLSFTLTGMVLLWGLFRYRLFSIVPVAREQVIESMRDGVIVIDDSGVLVDLNRAAQQIIGAPAAQLTGRPAEQVLGDLLQAAGARNPDIPGQAEITVVREGTTRHYEWESVPLHGWRGQTRGQVITLHDITEIRRASRELERAKAAAEAASRAKSTFLANMSHELRTPLHSIIGFSELLQEEAQDQGNVQLHTDLGRIAAAGRRLHELLGDVLDLSKIEAGRIELYLESFDVADLVGEVMTTAQPLAQERGNVLRLECPDDIGRMLSDQAKVRQVLLNLLGNAAKFTERGTIVLSAARERNTSADDWIRFEVSDTGIGISEEQMPNLFRAFAQADPAIAQQYGGTGLGLAISQRLCQALGGEITVTSQLGVGSTFTVRLPASAPMSPASAGPPAG